MNMNRLVVRVVLGMVAAAAAATTTACNREIPIGILEHLGGHDGNNGDGTGGISGGGVGGRQVTSTGGAGGDMATDGPAVRVVQAAPGWYHACALLADGTVRCWGNNYGGQLGDQTTLNHAQPVTVVRLA